MKDEMKDEDKAFSPPPLDSIIRKKIVFENRAPCALDKTLHIGYGIDALFARPAGVSITSVAANNPDIKLIFHVLASSIKQGDLDRFRRLAEMYPNITVNVYLIDNGFFADYPIVLNLTSAMYYRLMLPLLLEGDAERLLYIDADIVCLGAIDELIAADLSQFVALTVDDTRAAEAVHIPGFKLNYGRYFNSGVLLINVNEWQLQNVLLDTLNLLSSPDARALDFPDQDALNIVLDGKTGVLDRKWNAMPDIIQPAPSDVVFLHFCRRPKPWSISYFGPNQHLYFRYMNVSPWAGTPLQMPRNHREMKLYALKLLKKGLIGSSLYWFMRSLVKKLTFKLKLAPYNSVIAE